MSRGHSLTSCLKGLRFEPKQGMDESTDYFIFSVFGGIDGTSWQDSKVTSEPK